MHPVLFEIFGIQARSYYLLWAFALLLFLQLSFRRATVKYKIDASVASVLIWVYIMGIAGAFFGTVIEKLPLVLLGRENYTILFSGGSSACMGIFIGGITGLWKLRTKKIPLAPFADAVALPLSLMLCIGRVGCLLEGCCAGKIIAKNCCALHFPYDMPQIYRFPSQITEAVALLIITVLLYIVEKKYKDKFHGALIFPLFLILYGCYRLCFDHFRALALQRSFELGYPMSALAVAVGACWLISTLRQK